MVSSIARGCVCAVLSEAVRARDERWRSTQQERQALAAGKDKAEALQKDGAAALHDKDYAAALAAFEAALGVLAAVEDGRKGRRRDDPASPDQMERHRAFLRAELEQQRCDAHPALLVTSWLCCPGPWLPSAGDRCFLACSIGP